MAGDTINIEVKSNLGELNKDIGNTSKLVQGVEGSVEGAQKAMDAFGVSSETTNKSLKGVRTAMNFTEGIKQITNLGKVIKTNTTVQKLWNLAMKANPIGLIIAAVTTLIAGITALVFWLKKSSEQAKINTKLTEDNTTAIEEQTKALDENSAAFGRKQKQELAMAKASGESAEAIRELELKLIDEKIAFIASEEAIAKETLAKQKNVLATLEARGADEDLIEVQTKNVDQAEANLNKATKATEDALTERKDLNNRHLVEIRQDETNAAKQREADRKAAREKAAADKKAQEEKEFDDMEAENDQWNEDQLAKQDREKESADFLLALQQENTLGLIEDLQERALAELKIQEEKELASAELMENSEEIKEQIRQKYARLRGEVVKKMSENEIAWEDMTQEQKLNKVKNSAGEMAKILGEESEAGKAFAITQATIDTFQGANAAYSSMAKIPYVGPILGGVAAAAAIASGMANVKAIATASPASSGGGGGGSTASSRPAPQMMSGAFDIEGGIEPEATKAYVVTDEMTNSQNQLANIRRRATI